MAAGAGITAAPGEARDREKGRGLASGAVAAAAAVAARGEAEEGAAAATVTTEQFLSFVFLSLFNIESSSTELAAVCLYVCMFAARV